MTPNIAVNRTVKPLRGLIPSTLRAPAAGYRIHYAVGCSGDALHP